MREYAQWQPEAQRFVANWGTPSPVTLDQVRTDLFARNGRPLSELSKRPNPAEVLFEYKPGLKDGDRDTYEVNMSAFHEVAAHFDASLGLFSHVRHAVKKYPKKVTVEDVESVLHTVAALPIWRVFRSDKPIQNGEIEPEEAGAANIARGGLLVYFDHMKDTVMGTDHYRDKRFPLTTRAFVDTTFNDGWLVIDNGHELQRREREACPAPRIMIKQFGEVLFDKPGDQMAQAGSRLGLSREEMRRAIAFGKAFGEGLTVMDYLYGLEDQQGLRTIVPGMLAASTGAVYTREILGRCVSVLNSVQERMSVSLQRESPRPLIVDNILPINRGAGLGLPDPFKAFRTLK